MKFSIIQAFREGWSHLSGMKGAFWLAIMIMMLITFAVDVSVLGSMSLVLKPKAHEWSEIMNMSFIQHNVAAPHFRIIVGLMLLHMLCILCIHIPLMVGTIRIPLCHLRKQAYRFSTVFSGFQCKRWVNTVSLAILLFLIGILSVLVKDVLLMALLAGIPALHASMPIIDKVLMIFIMAYLSLVVFLTWVALADDLNCWDALGFAVRSLTPITIIKLIMAIFVMCISVLFSIALLFVGVIWMLPWTYLVHVDLYEQLKQKVSA